MYVNQTFTLAAIHRVPFSDPASSSVYFQAPPADAAAGLDGLARDSRGTLYAAANGLGQVWRVAGPALGLRPRATSLRSHRAPATLR